MTDELLRYVKQSDLDKGINYDNRNCISCFINDYIK